MNKFLLAAFLLCAFVVSVAPKKRKYHNLVLFSPPFNSYISLVILKDDKRLLQLSFILLIQLFTEMDSLGGGGHLLCRGNRGCAVSLSIFLARIFQSRISILNKNSKAG